MATGALLLSKESGATSSSPASASNLLCGLREIPYLLCISVSLLVKCRIISMSLLILGSAYRRETVKDT